MKSWTYFLREETNKKEKGKILLWCIDSSKITSAVFSVIFLVFLDFRNFLYNILAYGFLNDPLASFHVFFCFNYNIPWATKKRRNLRQLYPASFGFWARPSIALTFWSHLLQLSFGPIGWLMISEIFPLRVRGRGLSISVLVNFGANALVAFSFSPLQVKKTL